MEHNFFRLDTSDDNIICSKEIIGGNGIKCNTYDSDGVSDVIFKNNDNTFISLQGSTLNRVQISRFLRVVDSGGSTQGQFVESTNGNYMEFRFGNHINAYASGTPVNGNTLHLNYCSHGNVFLGTTQDTGEDPHSYN